MSLCMQIFFPLGPTSVAIFGGLGAILFSAFLVYDTDNLIKRYTYDEYIWASVALYLDILNLFLTILNMLRSMQSNSWGREERRRRNSKNLFSVQQS